MSERIEILKNILLDLHHGATAESVQAQFDEHFTGVSAIEISMMEHELMNSNTGITFEDVMKLCNVHANLFKNAIQEVGVADSEQAGHPVHTFRMENMALRSAILRIKRLLAAVQAQPNAEDGLLAGLKRQYELLGQFKHHYSRKEYVMFPIMERYGHDAPPKVMWGVDDQIRDLYDKSYADLLDFPNTSIAQVIESFEVFEHEFLEMIFKEESILLMILLETFSQDDWLAIAKDSDQYGYAIIKPEKEWVPERVDFTQAQPSLSVETDIANKEQIIETEQGTLTIKWEPKQDALQINDPHQLLPFGHGHLSLHQANLILNHLPIELTFVNKDDIFQYYNNHVPFEDMIFKRNPSQVGRNVELCHPPKLIERVKKVISLLRSGERDKVTMWFKRDEQFVHVTYMAVRNDDGEFEGVLELVQDIQPYFDLDSEMNREIT
ncbi:DUF438 domain-containing protein [Aerococcaceae bacterium zg-ZJ1578]|uniref:DUF438 domain-containing protein n=1 Tax=Aerococcaceae bacterium zg-252 TaxID=2796928 RepID=UPI001A28E87B|nr:DUF438 domain-containing protein [Aerococcaceae bacterium zg-1578]